MSDSSVDRPPQRPPTFGQERRWVVTAMSQDATWINQGTGEIHAGPCPLCAEHEQDVVTLESYVRTLRRKLRWNEALRSKRRISKPIAARGSATAAPGGDTGPT